MKVTQQILLKYSEGSATKEEILAVETWLKSESVEADEALFPWDQNKRQVRSEIRSELGIRIILHQQKRNSHLKNAVTWYVAAACTVIGLWGIGFYNNAHTNTENQTASFDNLNGKESKSFKTSDGLIFKLAAHSKVETNTNSADEISTVQFCGTMEITNRSGRDIQVIFSSTCKKSNNAKQVVTCKEGKSYVALQDHVRREEIIVVNRSRLGELPGQVAI